MILPYLFVSFMYFKIMPPFMFDHSNTVLGALMMAVASSFTVFGGLFVLERHSQNYQERRRNDPKVEAFFWTATLIAIAACLATSFTCYLVGVGFAAAFIEHILAATKGFSGLSATELQHNMLWFAIMTSTPGAILLVGRIIQGAGD